MTRKSKSTKNNTANSSAPKFSTDQMKFILYTTRFGAGGVMYDFAARYSRKEANKLLRQLYLNEQGEPHHPAENQQELDEFYIAMKELLLAVYHFNKDFVHEMIEMAGEES